MAKTTGDVIVEKLIDWGVDTVFGLPGDGINGIFEALRKNQDKIRFIQVPPRGGGGVRRLRLRQVHRPARRLHRHRRARGHPPAERPLRRQARQRPGAGHHRAHLPRPDRHALPAGDRPPPALHRRGRLTTSMILGPEHAATRWSTSPAARRCRAGASRTSHCRNGHPGLDALGRGVVAADGHGPHVLVVAAAHLGPAGRDAQGGRRAAQRRQEDRHPGRPGGAGRRRRARAAGRHRWPAPIVKPLLGKAVVPDDSPFTTGGIGLLGTRPSEEAMEECDTPAHGRDQLPLPEVAIPSPTRPRPCRSTSTRPGSACATRSTSAWSATPRRRSRRSCRCSSRKKDRSFLEKAQKGMKEWWELMRNREDARRHADQAAGRRAARQRPARGRRDHHDRLGHDHDLGGAAHPDPPGHEVLVLGQPGDDGAGPALRHRGPGRLPRPPGRRLRRRRRLHDADGRVRHGGQVQAADQGRHHQEQHARPDQVGADGLPGQSRVRRRAAPDRLREVRRGVRRRRLPLRDSPRRCGPRCRRRSRRNKPAIVEAVVDPFEPPMPAARHAASRRCTVRRVAGPRRAATRGKIIRSIFKDKIKELV